MCGLLLGVVVVLVAVVLARCCLFVVCCSWFIGRCVLCCLLWVVCCLLLWCVAGCGLFVGVRVCRVLVVRCCGSCDVCNSLSVVGCLLMDVR